MGESPLRCFLVLRSQRRLANSRNLLPKMVLQAACKGSTGKIRVSH